MDSLFISFCASTPMSESLVLDQIFRLCVVIVRAINTHVNLNILDMVYFNVILSIYWLSHYHAIVDCLAKTVTLSILGIHQIIWQIVVSHTPTGFI